MCLFEGHFCFFFWLLHKTKIQKLTTIITYIFEVDKNFEFYPRIILNNCFRLFGLETIAKKTG